jgi:hypothetical protein
VAEQAQADLPARDDCTAAFGIAGGTRQGRGDRVSDNGERLQPFLRSGSRQHGRKEHRERRNA